MTLDKDDSTECPLCMEPLDIDDVAFFPCTCGYQVCRFCWHRIRTDDNGLCPACRQPYSENPADFTPLSAADLQRLKAEKRQRRPRAVVPAHASSTSASSSSGADSRKQLVDVRVVQRNLVFVVGLPPRLADSDVLRRNEYFGQFGKIRKILVSHPSQQAMSQGQCASAHVTYCRPDDALRSIRAVNNALVDNKTLKVSLGTTKYCSLYLRHQNCSKTDCTFLHEPGDESASFTKEEMQAGKHQEYERRLLEHWLHQQQKRSLTNKDRPAGGGESVCSAARSADLDTTSVTSSAAAAAARGGVGKKSRGRRGRRRQNRTASPVDDSTLRSATPPEALSSSNATDDSQGRHSGESGRSSPLSLSDQGATTTVQRCVNTASSSVWQQQHEQTSDGGDDDGGTASVGEQCLSTPPTPPPDQHKTLCGQSVATDSRPNASSSSSSHQNTVAGFSSDLLGQPTPPPEPEDAEMSVLSVTSLTTPTQHQQAPPPAPSTSVLLACESADDDLDFDPFEETSKGLSELIERERQQMSSCMASNVAVAVTAGSHALSCPTDQFTVGVATPSLMSRARLPPPGFVAPVVDPSIVALGLSCRDSASVDASCQQRFSALSPSSAASSLDAVSMVGGVAVPPPSTSDRFMAPVSSSLLTHRPPPSLSAATDSLPVWDWSGHPAVRRQLPPQHRLPAHSHRHVLSGWTNLCGASSTATASLSSWPNVVSQQQQQPQQQQQQPVSRPDSPPHWLRAIEQLTETPPPPPGLLSSVPPPRSSRVTTEYF